MARVAGKEIDLKEGFTVRGRFQVVAKLGQGGFGAVYEMEDKVSGEHYAMKVESLLMKKQPVMKMEISVTRKMQGSKHAVEFVGCGLLEDIGISWLMMGLVGKNLSELRRECVRGRMTTATVVRTGKQCIQALKDLHRRGFVHRDVKPSNFAIGKTADTEQNIYLLDFGLARRCMDSYGELRPPRPYAGFKGTIRYSSLSAHRGMELGRQDDLAGLMYTMVELRKGLPWRTELNKSKVGKMKRDMSRRKLFSGLPIEIEKMFELLETLKYWDQPDYDRLTELLENVMKRKGYSDNNPYDWQDGGRSFQHTRSVRDPPSPPKLEIAEAEIDSKGSL